MTNLNSGGHGLLTPYRVPNWRVVYQPTASPLPQGSHRALAATANHFARESHMDVLAHRVSVDPLEFRLRHLVDERLGHVLRTAAGRIGWGSPRDGAPESGRGIACGIEKGGRVATAAELVVGLDRTLQIRRLVTAFDCGAVINPDNLANQIEGAVIMGLGGALFEAIDFADGRILNASLTTYRVPRLSDVPDVEVVVCDRPDQPCAGGGETPIIGVDPAIANAIADACGVRLHALPLVPDGTVPQPRRGDLVEVELES
jgi:isoquinoline 1-oxidoreductase